MLSATTKKGFRSPYAPRPLLSLVPEDGIEPSWGCPRGILRLKTVISTKPVISVNYHDFTGFFCTQEVGKCQGFLEFFWRGGHGFRHMVMGTISK